MDFSRAEWETILAALGGSKRLIALLRLLRRDEGKRAICQLAGGLGTPQQISALIERIATEEQR